MPPLRKKGRGGGGGKTEAPMPGHVPAVSPTVLSSKTSSGRRERDKGLSSDGLENLSALVSRSFQKERGERKLLDRTRTSLHLVAGFSQKGNRARKTEDNSIEGTPRVVYPSRIEDRERKCLDSSQRSIAPGFRSARRGGEETAVSRAACREVNDDKVWYRRSLRAGDDKVLRRVSRKDEKNAEFSTRYSNMHSGVPSGRDRKLLKLLDAPAKSVTPHSAEKSDNRSLSRASPISPAPSKRSPRSSADVNFHSPQSSLPVKSSCVCGFRSTDSANSPRFQERLAWIGVEDKFVRKGSPNPPPSVSAEISKRDNTDFVQDRKSRDHLDGVQGTLSTQLKHSQGSSTPGLLQGRLTLLEGRVNQIAAELKATKNLLDASNPVCSKALLTDIQAKISGIEKAINYRLARECGLAEQIDEAKAHTTCVDDSDAAARNFLEDKKHLLERGGDKSVSGGELVVHSNGTGSFGKLSKSVQSTRAFSLHSSSKHDAGITMSAAEKLSQLATFANSRGREQHSFQTMEQSVFSDVGKCATANLVKPVFDHSEFEERLFPHQRLMKNRPVIHQKLLENRAALHQKLMENSVLLRNKLAALEEREGVNCVVPDEGDLVISQLWTSLKQVQHQGLPRGRDPERVNISRGQVGASNLGDASKEYFEVLETRGHPIQDRMTSDKLTFLGSSAATISFMEGRSKSPAEERIMEAIPSSRSSGRKSFCSERRRKSLEKRKSISSSEGCSPETGPNLCQIVMLEPSRKNSDTTKGSLHLAFGGNGSSSRPSENLPNETLLSAGGDRYSKTWPKNLQQTIKPMQENSNHVNLDCGESLPSDEAIDERDYVVPSCGYNDPPAEPCEQDDNLLTERCHRIGDKIATAGWFTCEGDAILLAHDDGHCSFYDVANAEVKANYKAPNRQLSGVWRDCWLIRAAGPEGQSNKYVIAASAGGAVDSAFCSWNFYDRSICAYHCEAPSGFASPSIDSFKSSTSSSPDFQRSSSRKSRFPWYSGAENSLPAQPKDWSRPVPGELISSGFSPRHATHYPSDCDPLLAPLWWYRPCSPLLASLASGLKLVTLYDVRDGDVVMKWEVNRAVTSMDFSSPLQWRNRNRVVIAEDQGISLWDVNSTTPMRLHSTSFAGKHLQALHIRNCDAECSGGVRQRVSSRDSQGGDGVLCTNDAVNILDFRVPAGIALKIPTSGEDTKSVYVNGDAIFTGVSCYRSTSGLRVAPGDYAGNGSPGNVGCKVMQWSIKQGKLVDDYTLPDSSSHQSHLSITQVWGSGELVMAINGNGLFMFDALKGHQGNENGQKVHEVLGTDDLLEPSFDYGNSRVLLISRDRPASWCHWQR